MRVVARSAARARVAFSGLEGADAVEVVEARTDSAEDVAAALEGQDAAFACLAAFEAPHSQMSLLAANVVAAAEADANAPPLRLFAFGLIGLEEGTRTWTSDVVLTAMRFLSPFKFGPAIRDHRGQVDILRAAAARGSVNATIFQTVTMVGRAFRAGSPEACPDARLWHRVGYDDAADCCLRYLNARDLPVLQMAYTD